MTTKASLRQHYQTLRNSLPPRTLADLDLPNPGYVLSFVPHKNEIDLTPLNEILAEQNRLALPRIEENQIIPYAINDLRQLKKGSYGLLEPDPKSCQPIETLAYILVPGLAFDNEHHRLGYGGGFYDRLLAATQATTIGIGYKEQLTKQLPRELHDIQLDTLHLI